MVFRGAPFRGETEDDIYDAILTDEVNYDGVILSEEEDFIEFNKKLLRKDPADRLGSGPTDALEVMDAGAKWLGQPNWDDVYHKRLPPPIVPKVDSPLDTQNFDASFTNQEVALDRANAVLATGKFY
jgi:hypothetical protein